MNSLKKLKFMSFLFLFSLVLVGCSHTNKTPVAPTEDTDKKMEKSTDNKFMIVPSVSVDDQTIKNNSVLIKKVVSSDPAGWIVVHIEDNGKPGKIIGKTKVIAGDNDNVEVSITVDEVSNNLFAMLHVDAGTNKMFDFPNGADVPVKVDDAIVMQKFSAIKDEVKEMEKEEMESSAKIFNVAGTNFMFSMKEIRVKEGDTVTIVFKNDQGFHDWVIDEFNASTKQIREGDIDTVTFVANKKGTFEYYCSVGSHRQMGMVGNLIVE